MTTDALRVERLEAHWIEQLNDENEVVRVLCCGDAYLFRVVPYQDRSWILQQRQRAAYGLTWSTVRGEARGRYKVRPIRMWRSPQAAMRVAEGMTEVQVATPNEGKEP